MFILQRQEISFPTFYFERCFLWSDLPASLLDGTQFTNHFAVAFEPIVRASLSSYLLTRRSRLSRFNLRPPISFIISSSRHSPAIHATVCPLRCMSGQGGAKALSHLAALDFRLGPATLQVSLELTESMYFVVSNTGGHFPIRMKIRMLRTNHGIS